MIWGKTPYFWKHPQRFRARECFAACLAEIWVTMRMDADSEGVFWTPETPKKMDSEQIVVLYHGKVPPNHRKTSRSQTKIGNLLVAPS